MVDSGQVTVASAGTAVLAGTDTAVKHYVVRAHPDNTGHVGIGKKGVTMSTALVLSKSDGPTDYIGRLSELYVDAATSGDKLTWLAVSPV